MLRSSGCVIYHDKTHKDYMKNLHISWLSASSIQQFVFQSCWTGYIKSECEMVWMPDTADFSRMDYL